MKHKLFRSIFLILIVGMIFIVSCEYNKISVPTDTIVDSIASLDCNGAIITPKTIQINTNLNGMVSVPYTGGTGLNYTGGYTIQSNGLSLTLLAGKLTSSNGNILFSLTGTPTIGGVANFPIQFGGKTCTISLSVIAPNIDTPFISALNCGSATIPQNVVANTLFSGTIVVPYTGGNSVAYANGTSIQSTNVTGLTATLQAGTLSSSGNLTYNITGTALASGMANFNLSFAGKICNVGVVVKAAPVVNYTYTNSIKSILDNNCAIPFCHNTTTAAAGFDFSSYTSAKTNFTASSTRILGAIMHSSGFKPMPQGGAKLADTTINKIQSWVNANYPE